MKSLLFLMVVSSFLLGTAMGQTINFETLPGGGAISDGMLIHDQFNVSPYWVTFELLGVSPETGPKIARVGPDGPEPPRRSDFDPEPPLEA